MKDTIDEIIKTVEVFENPEEEFPRERLLEKLNIIRGFVDDMRFPEDEELETKRKSLARPNAGRRTGKLEQAPVKRQHYNKFRLEHSHDWGLYVNWCDKEDIPSDEMYTKESFRKIKAR